MNPLTTSTTSMHLIPEAAARPGDDPIFALNAEATSRAARGERIVNATLGALMEDDGKLGVLPAVFEAQRRVPPERAASYAPISGAPRFLAAVVRDLFGASELARRSVAVSTPGGTGALHHAVVNFLEPGQALLTSSYYWGPYETIATHTRRRVETFETFDARGGFHLAAFERALLRSVEAQGRALVLLNTPCHNPTGYSLDAREWERLAEIVLAAGERGPVTLVLDYAYARFSPAGAADWRPQAERISERQALLVAWSASKTFAQYGARVGALVAVHAEAEERARIQSALGFSCRGTWSNCNHLGQLAVTELLEDADLRARSDAERERLRALLAARVAAFNEHARRLGVRTPRYEGGFFVAVFAADAARAAETLRREGIYVVPLNGALRVALCSTPAAEIPRLVEQLALATGAAAAPRAGGRVA